MDTVPFEIERKFLIRMPDLDWLSSCAERSHIVQTYLLSEADECSERVRVRRYPDRCVYTHTAKTHLSDIRRIENEEEIDRESYERFLQRADPERRAIEKDRYCLWDRGLLFEIDVFPFWKRQAFLEIELTDENQDFALPQKIRCIREVTADRRYTNSALAFRIPEEDDWKEE